MRLQAAQHWVMGFIAFATMLWLDIVPAEMLLRVGLFTLAWAGASTLLVASIGAWVAIARMRHQPMR